MVAKIPAEDVVIKDVIDVGDSYSVWVDRGVGSERDGVGNAFSYNRVRTILGMYVRRGSWCMVWDG